MATAIDPALAAPAHSTGAQADAGDTSLVILQSLLCLLREKNVLSRADIEDLTQRIRTRAADHDRDPLPCCVTDAARAAAEMGQIDQYIGRRYGGKHRRGA